MKNHRLAAASLLLCAAGLACAQTYPAKPIRLIVPFPPGGGNDTVARAIADQASPALGQPIVVDNRPGAGGIIGADAAAKAAPDGYTLFLGGVGSHAVNPNMHPKLSYDAVKDFAPITLDSIRALQSEHGFISSDIDRIDVHGSQVTADHVGWKYEPKGLTAAQLNLPFCVATYLLEGDCFVDQFDEGCVHDARRIALSERVHVHADPAITARGAKFRHSVRVAVHRRFCIEP